MPKLILDMVKAAGANAAAKGIKIPPPPRFSPPAQKVAAAARTVKPRLPAPTPPPLPSRKVVPVKPQKLSGNQRLASGFTDKSQPTKMYRSREELRKATQAQSRTSQGLTSVKKMPTVGYAKPRNLPTKKKRFGIFSNGDRYRTYNFRYPRYTRNYNFAYPH